MTAIDIVKCPRCGSSETKTGERGWSPLTGFIGSGTVITTCRACGHEFKPAHVRPESAPRPSTAREPSPNGRIRKGLYLGIFIPATALALVLDYVGYVGWVVWLVMTYKMWAAVEGPHARTSARKAVWKLFIPFYNLYWLFQVYPGFATDYRLQAAELAIRSEKPSPRVSGGLMVAHCILFLSVFLLKSPVADAFHKIAETDPAAWAAATSSTIAILLITSALASLVVDMILINSVCNAVNWLAECRESHPYDPASARDGTDVGAATSVRGAMSPMSVPAAPPEETAADLYSKGIAADAEGHHSDAVMLYDRALTLQPTDTDVLFRKGDSLGVLQRWPEALECYKKLIALKPEESRYLYGKACAEDQLGLRELATASYTDYLLRVDPTDHDRIRHVQERLRSLRS